MSLISNPEANKYVGIYAEYTEGSDRNEIFIYENNTHEDIVSNIYAMLDIYIQPNTKIFMNNNKYVNISGLYGGAYIYYAGEISITNTTFINSTDFGSGIITLEE